MVDNEHILEISDFSEFVDRYIDTTFDLTDPKSTQAICVGLYRSIVSLVKGLSACIAVRSYNGMNVLYRSIAEFMIDLRLIALSDSERLNTMFVGYMKLKRYFLKIRIKDHANDMPQIQREYREYVRQVFPEEVLKCTERDSGEEIINWKALDKELRKKYKNSWYGASTEVRYEQVLKLTQEQKPFEDVDISRGEPGLYRLYDMFCITSNFTHPTPLSGLPHFRPATGEFELSFNHSEDQRQQWRSHAIQHLLSAMESLACCLPENDRKAFLKARDLNMVRRPKLMSLYLGTPHATSPGNE